MDHIQPSRASDFLRDYRKPTREIFLEKRAAVLDLRIQNAGLTLEDKVDAFKQLSPRLDPTSAREELRMERLLYSVPPDCLPLFKFMLEYDGDYKDVAEYVFHDIDKKEHQDRIIEHFKTGRRGVGIKVLTDVDDTMYANLIDTRYPKKTLYPGVLEFYDALQREPFDLTTIPVTTLTARPTPVAGTFEECSIESLTKLTNGRLSPSSLSGELISGVAGSLQTWARANLHRLAGKVPHDQEDKIGRVKFENFSVFSIVYPEYRFVFIGDSGQADALTAQLLINEKSCEGTSRVITTFIHDLREHEDDQKSVSATFRNVPAEMLINELSESGRGVIVFRNYIAAALVAYAHSSTLENLITADKLAKVTRAALTQFQTIDFATKQASQHKLRQQYRQDADAACTLLTRASQPSAAMVEEIRQIRHILDTDPAFQ
jgi:hypothetical protein